MFTVPRLSSVSAEHDTSIWKMLQLQPIQQILGYNTIMASNNETMEVVIRRVGMEDHINIVKLFQVCFSKFTIGIF